MSLRCKKCGRLVSKNGTHTCPIFSWNKGKKGVQVSHNKGKKLPESTKTKISDTRKKKIALGEIKKTFGADNPMYKKIPWNKGKKLGPSVKRGTKVPEHIRKKTAGPNHYKWNGGYRSVNLRIRKCYEYRQWVQDVLKRDNYTCQECMNRGGKLEVHHIKPFAIIVKENHIKSVDEALNCYELWEYTNAVTLCKPCHKKTDSYLKSI